MKKRLGDILLGLSLVFSGMGLNIPPRRPMFAIPGLIALLMGVGWIVYSLSKKSK